MKPIADVNAHLVVLPDFLSAAACDRLRCEMHSALVVPAGVFEDDKANINEDVRRSQSAGVSETTMAAVRAWLQELQPRLELHYHLRLSSCERPQFLMYREGDFFGAHQDSADDPNCPLYLRQRRVSVVLFLNGQSPAPGPDVYGGGSLLFFDFLGMQRGEYAQVRGERGLLVAFPAWLYHMVTKIQHGTRYTIVSWFPGAGSEG